MNCEQVKKQLALWAGGDLDPVSAVALDNHVAACATCRTAAERWQKQLVKIKAELVAEEAPGPSFSDLDAAVSLAMKHRHQKTAKSRWWSGYRIKAVAAMVVFLFLGYFLAENIPRLLQPGQPITPGTVAWSDLQDFFDDCLSEPVAVSRWQGNSEPGLLTVLVRSQDGDRYRVVECVAAPDLAGLRSYPWLAQRLRKLELQAGGGELLVTTCATGALDGANRRRVRQDFLRQFKRQDDS